MLEAKINKSTSIVKNTVVYAAANIFLRGAGFFLLPLLTHYISREDYGYYSMLSAGYIFSVSLFQGGILGAFSKFFIEAKTETHKKEVFSFLGLWLISGSALMGLLCFFCAPIISVWLRGDKSFDIVIKLLSVSFFYEGLFALVQQLSKTKEEAGKVILYSSINAVINIFLSVIFIVCYNLGLIGLVLAQAAAFVITDIFLLPVARGLITIKKQYTGAGIMAKFTIPLIIAGLLVVITDAADRFILNQYFDSAVVGVYSFFYKIAAVMYTYIIAFRAAWTPHAIIKVKEGSYEEHFGKVFSKFIFMGLGIVLAAGLLVPVIFSLKLSSTTYLFNQSYKDGMIILPYVLIAYFFNGMIYFYSIYPYIRGKSSYFLAADLISASVNIALNLLLIPLYGLKGAGLATLISYFAPVGYLYFLSRDKIHIIYRKADIWFLTISAVLLFAAGTLANNLIVSILCIVLYGGAGFYTKQIHFKNNGKVSPNK